MAGEIKPDNEWGMGEAVSLPPDFIADRISQAAKPMDYLSHARVVGDIHAADGTIYRTGLAEVEATLSKDVEGHYDVKLKSRKNKIILAAGGAILFAAGAGAALQFNRTHRKKKRR
jgi:hypothetical protein